MIFSLPKGVRRLAPLVTTVTGAAEGVKPQVLLRAAHDAFVDGGSLEKLASVNAVVPNVFGAAPTAYGARIERGVRTAMAVIDGVGEAEISIGGRQSPSHLAEAGKPLLVNVGVDRFSTSPLQKVDLTWRFDTGPEARQSISDGTRDQNGLLVLSQGHIDIPPEASGTMRLRVETTDVKGKVTTHWDPVQDVRVIPLARATAVFGADGTLSIDGTIRPGDGLTLAYDHARLRKLLGGEPATKIIASVRTNKREVDELPLLISNEQGAVGTLLPTIAVPFGATSLEVWVRAEKANGEVVYDSAEGANHQLPVGIARDDADPAWKRMVLNAKIGSGKTYPNATAENFVGLGPNSPSYNCIAWTLGKRNEWVWPGETVKAFDALYANAGYQPLETFDASFDPALEKVAIYGRKGALSGRVEVLHGAHQELDGEWTSKLGADYLIRHKTLEVINGFSFGEPVRVYARPRGARS